MAPKLRNQWLSFPGMVALKVRTGGSERAGIIIIHQARKKGLGYLTKMTVDTSHGIITGVGCYPANQRESDIILEHLQG